MASGSHGAICLSVCPTVCQDVSSLAGFASSLPSVPVCMCELAERQSSSHHCWHRLHTHNPVINPEIMQCTEMHSTLPPQETGKGGSERLREGEREDGRKEGEKERECLWLH